MTSESKLTRICKTCKHYGTVIINKEWVKIGCKLEYYPEFPYGYCPYYRTSYEYRYNMLEKEGLEPMEILDIMYREGYSYE